MAIALVDCNSFYCSCEIAFRPDLEKRPVVVLSNNDGCVVSRTNSAKKLNIKMAQPLFQIKNIIKRNNVAFFSSNYALYADMSSRVMGILAQFTPEMEVYSIDEAFLNLDGFGHLDLNTYGAAIKKKVFQDVHIPVSVGIAQTKVLAKLANHIAKKSVKANGVVDLTQTRFHDRALSIVAIEDIWGIGRQSANKLRLLGIKNAKDFRDFKNERLIGKLLTKVGLQIKQELQGIKCFPLSLYVEKKKQIISSRTFGRPVFDLEDLRESIANYITTAAEKLRNQGSIATKLTVYIRTNPFKNTPQYYNFGNKNFLSGTSDTRKLITEGLEILESIYRPGFEYKKTGISLSDLRDKELCQVNFFDEVDSKKDDVLMSTMDNINSREGKNTLKSAACGLNSTWWMAREFKSPCYTTRWSDILKVS